MMRLLRFLCFFSVAGLLFAGGQQAKPYIAMIAKGEQHDFWQQVRKGSLAAAEELDIDFTFEGPPTESDIQIQVEMLNSAIAKKPSAIGLAALDTQSVVEQLEQTLREGIPVIGFDSGIPNAPAGSIAANVATDNYGVSGFAAEKMFEKIRQRLSQVSEENPATIVILSQDNISSSALKRGQGFRDGLIELLSGLSNIDREDISVIGSPVYIGENSPKNGKKVFIDNVVPASSAITDAAATALAILNRAQDNNLLGIFASNELTAKAILVATDDGRELPPYGLAVVGFDAGKAQKDAVRKGYFLGSITQDPYDIGYQAVYTAYKAYKGEAVEDINTAFHFYTSENMDDPDIRDLLYD